MQYVFHTRVVKLEQKSKLLRSIKAKDGEIHNEYENMGWYVLLDGMLDSIWISMEKPDLEINQKVKFTISTEP
jgi:hypothetical protein